MRIALYLTGSEIQQSLVSVGPFAARVSSGVGEFRGFLTQNLEDVLPQTFAIFSCNKIAYSGKTFYCILPICKIAVRETYEFWKHSS